MSTTCHVVAERAVNDLGGFDNFMGLPLTPPGMEVLDSRDLDPSDVLGHTHYLLLHLAVRYQTVAIPRGDAASQDALNGAAIELLRTRSQIFSAS